MTHSPLSQWADKSPGRWILVWCALLSLWIFGSSITAEPEPEAKAVAAPVAKSAVQLSKLEAMQEQVGPEGICTELAKKTVCKDKHGRLVVTIIKEKK